MSYFDPTANVCVCVCVCVYACLCVCVSVHVGGVHSHVFFQYCCSFQQSIILVAANFMISLSIVLKFLKMLLFCFERERDRQSTSGGGAEREGDRI